MNDRKKTKRSQRAKYKGNESITKNSHYWGIFLSLKEAFEFCYGLKKNSKLYDNRPGVTYPYISSGNQ